MGEKPFEKRIRLRTTKQRYSNDHNDTYEAVPHNRNSGFGSSCLLGVDGKEKKEMEITAHQKREREIATSMTYKSWTIQRPIASFTSCNKVTRRETGCRRGESLCKDRGRERDMVGGGYSPRWPHFVGRLGWVRAQNSFTKSMAGGWANDQPPAYEN